MTQSALPPDEQEPQWLPSKDIISLIVFTLFALTLLSHVLLTGMNPAFMTAQLQWIAFPVVYITFIASGFFLYRNKAVRATHVLFIGMAIEQLLLLFFVTGYAPFIFISLLNTVLLAGLVFGAKSAFHAGIYVCTAVILFGTLKDALPTLLASHTTMDSESLLLVNLSTLSFTICVMYISIRRFTSLSSSLEQKKEEAQKALDALRLAEGENQRRAQLGDVLGNISEVATKASELSSIIDQLFQGTQGLLNERLFAFFQVRGERWELVGCDGELANAFELQQENWSGIPIKGGFGTDTIRRDVASQAPNLEPYILGEDQLEALKLNTDGVKPQSCLLYPIGERQHLLGALLLVSRQDRFDDLTSHRFCLTLRPILNVWLARQEIIRGLIQTQKMETVGILSGRVAHDFNNLLSTVFGNSELILYQNKENPALRERMETVQQATKEAAGLTQKLLSFTRKQGWNPSSHDLNGLIREFIPLLLPAMSTNIELRVALYEGNLRISVDEGDFKNLLSNIILNAQEATENRGIIEVRTSLEEPTEAGTRQAIITIRDNGSGMNEETVSKAFLPFFTTKKNRVSSGLGLSTSYGITQRFGGSISLESQEGHGTLVTITLPLEEAAHSLTEADPPPALEAPATILTVNLDSHVEEVLRDTLEDAGYIWKGATTEAASLDILREPGPPCAIITDATTSSLEWLSAMGRDFPQSPIVLLGSNPLIRDTSGYYCVKQPIVMETFIEQVKNALNDSLDPGLSSNQPDHSARGVNNDS